MISYHFILKLCDAVAVFYSETYIKKGMINYRVRECLKKTPISYLPGLEKYIQTTTNMNDERHEPP